MRYIYVFTVMKCPKYPVKWKQKQTNKQVAEPSIEHNSGLFAVAVTGQ